MDIALVAAEDNAQRSARRWKAKRNGVMYTSYESFIALTIEELGESVRARLDGDDLVALELIQALGLILNALRWFCTEDEIRTAWIEEQRRHP